MLIDETKQLRRLSDEEMNKIMEENIPLEDRLKAVYIPTILMDSACNMIEHILLRFMKAEKFQATRKLAACLRDSISEYRHVNQKAMGLKLDIAVKNKSEKFFLSIAHDLNVTMFSYSQLLYNMKHVSLARGTGKYAVQVLACGYTVQMILKYILQYDRECTKKIKEMLEGKVYYNAQDDVFCTHILYLIETIIQAFGGPNELHNDNIELSYKIFKYAVDKIDITDI